MTSMRCKAMMFGLLSASIGFGTSLAVAETGRASQRKPLSGTLLITGSSTMAPVVTAIAQRFRTLHPG
jgi:ABC-type phosphate transport system substrate-binding protein